MAGKLYIDLAAHPQTILDAMDRMRSAIEKAERQQKWMRLINPLRIALIIVGIVFLILEYPLIGIVLIIIPLASFFVYSPQKSFPKARFDTAYQVIHTLRDDTGRKGRLVGRLDLSPPNQKTKQFRVGTTSSGKPKIYYRDPWFVAKLKLVDGSSVKLQLEDRIKEKRGSFVYHQTLFENKIAINPGLYHTDYRHDQARPEVLIDSGQMETKQFHVEPMLEELKRLYDRVRPVSVATADPPAVLDAAPANPQPPANPADSGPSAIP